MFDIMTALRNQMQYRGHIKAGLSKGHDATT